MSDRIAIMREGRIEQIGAPEDIYERPQTRFAAEFIGQTNFLDCRVESVQPDGAPTLNCQGMRVPGRVSRLALRPGDEVSVCLRMERTRILRAPEGPCALPATLRSRHYAGGAIREIAVLASGQEVVALSQTAGEDRIPQGEQAFVCWNPREAALVR